MTIKYLRINAFTSKFSLRTVIKTKISGNSYLSSLFKSTNIPVHTLDNAVFDVVKARKAALSNLKKSNIKHFRLRYKKQSHHQMILVLEASVFNLDGTGLKNKKLKNLNPTVKINPTKDTRLQYNKRTKKFCLFIPYEKTSNNTVNRYAICALDPGVKTFQTLYSPEVTYQFGDDKEVINKNINRIEKVNMYKDKKWYKKYTERLREKLKNRITDLHWKTSSFLCKNFDTILIGNMSTKGIVSKRNNLRPQTKRTALALSHFLFKQRLTSKAKEFNCIFKVVDESYTTKTCGRCGKLNDNVGCLSVFRCPHDWCFYRMDRDINAARNIYIKHT